MKLVITMAQAARYTLPQALKDLGAEILRQGYAEDYTSWRVLAAFPPRTKQRDVTQALWAKYPGSSVNVKKVTAAEVDAMLQ